ncbi:SnoaL-like domain-containing protein [Sphingorhabdus sp.]|uniref:SnoaL-like domain-containing protein n=1 Tax=Sphingorhabdus sp. TaxID=1902408 RepID=UPI003983319B
MASITDIARDFTSMLRQGQFVAARERYWAADVRSIEPHDLPDGIKAEVLGFDAARAKTVRWFVSRKVRDVTIDGPFVTGNQFALFLDMMIAGQPNGFAEPFTEIAIFTVRDGRISEERFFYD